MKLTGLQKICRIYGAIDLGGVRYVWDYEAEKAVPENEISSEQFAASEKTKWTRLKTAIENKMGETATRT